MNPSLKAISGPLRESVFPIANAPLTIGRSEANQICLPDAAVSRQHCILEQTGDRFQIRDLDSRNRTYVNGSPIGVHVLNDGDQIRVGESVFLFSRDGEERNAHVLPLPGDSQLSSTVILRQEDAVYREPHKAVNFISSGDRAIQHLSCLLKIGEAISSTHALPDLARRLLITISGAIPVESAAILLTTPEPDNYVEFWWSSSQSKVEESLPRGILQQVLRDRISIWANDVLNDDLIRPTESIVALDLKAVLAVPLLSRDRLLGVLYGASRSDLRRFSAHDLQLLTGIASLAAGSLETALHVEMLERENRRLLDQIDPETQLVGRSQSIRELNALIAKVAPTRSTVLVTGESGTGKELVARAIHRKSPRASKPFVAINCATLSETLLESELFGHEKGAFTGAVSQKKGKLEEANGGTIFLDEIGEMAPGLQAKLLRVLQEREFERVGGTRTLQVDIRVIAATNRDLAEMARTGGFRQDLYYRLNVVSASTPALRRHREDIPLLCHHFIQKHAAIIGRKISGISHEAMDCLTRYDWPGNVRELENVIERSIVLGSTEQILLNDLPETVLEVMSAPAGSAGTTFHDQVNEAKRRIILAALERAAGRYTEAARELDIHPNNLHRLIRNLNIKGMSSNR